MTRSQVDDADKRLAELYGETAEITIVCEHYPSLSVGSSHISDLK